MENSTQTTQTTQNSLTSIDLKKIRYGKIIIVTPEYKKRDDKMLKMMENDALYTLYLEELKSQNTNK